MRVEICDVGPRDGLQNESVVYLLEREGIDTQVDLDELVRVAEWLEGVVGHDLPGRVYRAGRWP